MSFWLRLGIETNTRILDSLWLFPSTITSGILIYFFTGQYRGLTRHLKSKALYQIVGRNFLIILVISLISVMGELTMPPRSSLFLLWILLSVFVGGLRFIIRDALLKNRQIYSEYKPKENVVIYGAGTAGARLASSLKNEDSTNILFFCGRFSFFKWKDS